MSMAVVESLRALRLLLPQNQLKDGSMAEIEVGQTSPADTTIARGHGLGGAFSLLGMMLAGALVLVLLTNAWPSPWCSACWRCWRWPACSSSSVCFPGFLRLGERAAEAEMVKTVADGLDSALQIVNAQGSVLYRNRALQRLTGRRAGRHATLEELFAGEPDSAQAFFRLNRAAERGEARDEEFYVRSRLGRGPRRPLAARRCAPVSGAARRQSTPPADALAGRRTSRASARARSKPSAGWNRRLPSTTACRRACSPSRRTGASPMSTPRCRNGCACARSRAAR